MIITIEGKKYEFDLVIDNMLEILSVLKSHQEKGDNICTINFQLEGKEFFKEFQYLSYLANFLAGIAIGESMAMEKLEEQLEDRS